MGNLTLPGGPQVAFGQIDHYEPFVVVDIADLAGDQDFLNTGNGEAMDVNDQLFACGWYNDGSYDRPFFLNPLDGGEAYELPMSTYESGRALAINDPGSYELTDLIVVGWVDDGTNGPRAAYWTNNGTTWSLNLVDDLESIDSVASAVDADGAVIVGYWSDSGTSRPFDFDVNSTTTNKWTTIAGYGIGLDASGELMAGTRTDVSGPPAPIAFQHDFTAPSTTYLSVSGYHQTYGVSVNGFGDVVGYATNTTASTTDGVLWWSNGNGTWTARVLDQDLPNPVESTLTAVADKAEGTVDIVGTYWDSNNPDGAFYVTLDSNGDYLSYSLDAVTSGGGQHDSLVFFPLRIRLEVEDNSWTPQTYSANGINGIATIAGSYYDGAVSPTTPTVRPCLYVANDMDNDGKPDIREILQARLAEDPELDDNGNWMLDWAENDQDYESAKNMRAGLHSPGLNGKVSNGNHLHAVEYTQIVRFLTDLDGVPPNQINVDNDVYSIENIVHGEEDTVTELPSCEVVFNRYREWATLGDGHDQQREIVVTVTNEHPGDSGKDEILTPSDNDWLPALADIRTYAFRFAHCIDYMQFGNESIKGAQEWADDEGTSLFCLDDSSGEYTALLMDGVDWVRAQVEAARIGSALAGRPLRFITPGFPVGVINTGADGNPDGTIDNCNKPCEELDECDHTPNKLALGMREIARVAKEERMYFDMHLHYLTLTQANDGLDDMINAEVDAWEDTAEGDLLPQLKVILEFGPKGDKSMGATWNALVSEMGEFFDSNGSPANFDTWDEMIKSRNDQNLGWEMTQYDDGTYGEKFQMADLLQNRIDLEEYAAVCYGPSVQKETIEEGGNPVFLIAAAQASRVQNPSTWLCDSTHQFSPILRYTTSWHLCAGTSPPPEDNYEAIISAFEIDDFTPHCEDNGPCDECIEDVACPDQ